MNGKKKYLQLLRVMAFIQNIHFAGGQDCAMKLWDFAKFSEEISFDDINVCHNPDIKKDRSQYLLRTFGTKQSPITTLFFTRRNVLFAVTYRKTDD